MATIASRGAYSYPRLLCSDLWISSSCLSRYRADSGVALAGYFLSKFVLGTCKSLKMRHQQAELRQKHDTEMEFCTYPE